MKKLYQIVLILFLIVPNKQTKADNDDLFGIQTSYFDRIELNHCREHEQQVWIDQIIYYNYEQWYDSYENTYQWKYIAHDYRVIPTSARYPRRGTKEYDEAKQEHLRQHFTAYNAQWIGHNMIPSWNSNIGMYEAFFWDNVDGTMRRILTPVFQETFTSWDPENVNRSYMRSNQRPRLFSPRKIDNGDYRKLMELFDNLLDFVP